ncbi:hypothetical protein Q5P01_013638 [Channa striata]|uniref:Ig-like domain-containing protein n=1 Tax=Channa striata TaxID=64152 RepID=A0AA88MKH9_CHASR|nr:hypothetical protein Q5P01_013638 [Channa striata]
MVTMFRREQVALLSIQLLVMCHVHAEVALDDHRNKYVSTGETITLTCNIKDNSPRQIHWSKGNCVFAYSPSDNLTFSSFTSKRLKINPDLPSTLHISNAQHKDAGLYICRVTGRRVINTITWNLTVSENRREGSIQPPYFLYILIPVIGFLLCIFISSVCICRKLRTWTLNKNPAQMETRIPSGGEEVISQPPGDTDHWRNNKHRSQYMERINSVYGHI